MSLPFLAKKPIDLPPIISVELIQITDKTNIPFAPKAKKIIEKIKEKEKKLVSEQAPPKKVKKIKPDAVPMPDDKTKKIEKVRHLDKIRPNSGLATSKVQTTVRTPPASCSATRLESLPASASPHVTTDPSFFNAAKALPLPYTVCTPSDTCA